MLDIKKTNTRSGLSREDIIKTKKRSINEMLKGNSNSFTIKPLSDIDFDDDDDLLDVDSAIVPEAEKEEPKEVLMAKYEKELGFPLSDDQFDAIQGITKFICSEYDPENFSATLCGYAGTGKGLVKHTPVLTSRGWKSIGELSPKDLVATPEGNFAAINGIFHRGKQQVYRIKFSDGRAITCDGDHLWTLSRTSSFSVHNCDSLIVDEIKTFDTRTLFDIYKHFKLYLPKINPQICVIADGDISYNLDKREVFVKNTVAKVSINKRFKFYHDVLSKFGSFIAGKMNVECDNSNVINVFVDVARSLGYSYECWYNEDAETFCAKKVEGVYIESISENGEDETVCIKIDSKSELFITANYIPTHNTTVTKLIYNNCKNRGLSVSLCAPTHRAKYVLSKSIGETAETLHSFLHLSPTLDIEKLSMDDLIFKMDFSVLRNMPMGGVVFVDECSMISDEMFDFLKRLSNELQCKLLYIGDDRQLKAVNADDISKVFRLGNVYTLKTVHRQKNESALVPYLAACREKPVNNFKTEISPNGSVYVMSSPKDFMRSYIREVKKSIEEGKPDNTRILCYRNARVKEFNDVVRKCLYKGDEYDIPYHFGDILMGYSNMEYNGVYFYNSSDYIITSKPERIVVDVNPNISIPCWEMTLNDFYNNNASVTIAIADMPKIPKFIKDEYAKYLELLRMNAVNANPSQRKKAWDRWKYAFNMFAINEPLMYDNRVIKQKTFDYGYALSVHKSRLGTFPVKCWESPKGVLLKRRGKPQTV